LVSFLTTFLELIEKIIEPKIKNPIKPNQIYVWRVILFFGLAANGVGIICD
jgi:hypothetical protein